MFHGGYKMTLMMDEQLELALGLDLLKANFISPKKVFIHGLVKSYSSNPIK